MGDNPYRIESVSRALRVLECLADQVPVGGITDIAREIGCSKNNVFRILKTLQEAGVVRQADDSSYELTFKLLNLGESVLRNTDLSTTSRPYLQELVGRFGETASLAILDGHDIVYLDRCLGSKPYHTAYPVGSRAKAYSTALGKAILAHSPSEMVEGIIGVGLQPITPRTIADPARLRAELRTIAKRGYAVDHEENVLGVCCVGAPVFDRRGDAVAAISVSGLCIRITDDRVQVLAESLLSKAAAISSRLGYVRSRKHAH